MIINKEQGKPVLKDNGTKIQYRVQKQRNKQSGSLEINDHCKMRDTEKRNEMKQQSRNRVEMIERQK